MANEITISSYLQYANVAAGITQVNYPFTNAIKSINIAGKNYSFGTKSFPTTAGGTAIPLGGVSTPGGWAIFQNLDATNYAQVLSAVNGTVFARLTPTDPPIVLRLDDGVTAPAILANTAAVICAYLILEK